MAYMKAVTKGCIICGGEVDSASISSICNECKDKMSGRKPPDKPKKR